MSSLPEPEHLFWRNFHPSFLPTVRSGPPPYPDRVLRLRLWSSRFLMLPKSPLAQMAWVCECLDLFPGTSPPFHVCPPLVLFGPCQTLILSLPSPVFYFVSPCWFWLSLPCEYLSSSVVISLSSFLDSPRPPRVKLPDPLLLPIVFFTFYPSRLV